MRKALLIGAVVGISGLIAHRRFRRQLADAVRLPAAVALAVLVAPFDLLDDIGGVISGGAGAIRDAVLAIIRPIVGFLKSLLDQLFSLVDDLWSALDDLFNQAIGFVESLWNQLYGIVSGLIHDVWNMAVGLFNDAINFVTALFHDLVRWASEAISAVSDFFTGLFHDLVRWASEAINTLRGWITDALKWLWDSVIKPVWDFLFGWAKKLLEVVEKCYDWLVKLAEHGPGWVIQQVEETFAAAPDWLANHLTDSMARQGDAVESFFADWLG